METYKGKKKYNNKVEDTDIQYNYTPFVEEVENAVLGAILCDINSIDIVMGDFNANLFYSEKNAIIADAILDLYKQHKPIDILTVCQKLKEKSHLEKAGGGYYVSNLTSKITSGVHIEYHVKILQQEALRRNIIKSCTKGVQMAFDVNEDVFDTYSNVLVEIEGALKSIIHYQVKNVGAIHKEILEEANIIATTGVKSGVPSGLRLVDNVTNGWQKSELIILAGRPGMGKTAAAISMCLYPAINEKMAVAIFSLEMSNHQLVSRMQSCFSGVNVGKIVKKQINNDEINTIYKEASVLEDAPIYIDDTPNITLIDLKGKVRKLVKENNVKLVVIDYLQLMRSGLNILNREQEIAEISRGLKGLAKELDIPIIALSQLSRVVESRQDKKPMLSDLRESGQIEQDADMVVFCFRPEYYNIESYEIGGEIFESKGLFMLIIAKHRNGELGEIPLTFIHEQTKITNHRTFTNNISENNRTFVQLNEGTARSNVKLLDNANFLSSSEDSPF